MNDPVQLTLDLGEIVEVKQLDFHVHQLDGYGFRDIKDELAKDGWEYVDDGDSRHPFGAKDLTPEYDIFYKTYRLTFERSIKL